MKIPSVPEGYKRKWFRCKRRGCRRVFYMDFIPYAISSPIMVTPCGHSLGCRDYSMAEITAREARVALRAESKGGSGK